MQLALNVLLPFSVFIFFSIFEIKSVEAITYEERHAEIFVSVKAKGIKPKWKVSLCLYLDLTMPLKNTVFSLKKC